MQFQSNAASRYRLSALAGKSRQKSRMPQLLLGSVALAAPLLVGLVLLGHWQAEASGAAVHTPALAGAAYAAGIPRFPPRSEVLRNPPPVQAEPVTTF